MSNGGNQQVDVLKKSLEMVDKFLDDREKELVTFKNFGIDTEPLEVLYKHFRELLQEMLAAPSPRAFHDMMLALSQQIAGVLIIVKPGSANDVMADMQSAHPTMDPNQFADLIKDINKHTNFKASAAPSTTENPVNDKEELVDMLDLKNHVKQGGKKKSKAEVSDDDEFETEDEAPENAAPVDPFKSIYDKYQ